MSNRSQGFKKGRTDGRSGKPSNPPGIGIGKLAAAGIGAALLGDPTGALIGALVGDNKATSQQRAGYKAGYKKR